jgi:hypothetical protein
VRAVMDALVQLFRDERAAIEGRSLDAAGPLLASGVDPRIAAST